MIKLLGLMVLQITLPLENKNNIKNLIFNILIYESPLKIIQLNNFIRKRYGRIVTFQAVRKAILELINEEVAIKTERGFSINKEWVRESKKLMDELYSKIYEEKTLSKNVDSIGNEISVFTFNSLNEMMKFWEDLIINWFKKIKDGDYKYNFFQGAHGWEGLLHSDKEKSVMEQLKHKGIKSHVLFTSNSPLDKSLLKFYTDIGLKGRINKSNSHFDKTYYVATYGDLVVQTQYSEELARELDKFFNKNKKIETLNLKELSDIVNKKIEIKLSVTKNLNMAKQINESILKQME